MHDDEAKYASLVRTAKARSGGERGWARLDAARQGALVGREVMALLINQTPDQDPHAYGRLSDTMAAQLVDQFAAA